MRGSRSRSVIYGVCKLKLFPKCLERGVVFTLLTISLSYQNQRLGSLFAISTLFVKAKRFFNVNKTFIYIASIYQQAPKRQKASGFSVTSFIHLRDLDCLPEVGFSLRVFATEEECITQVN